jgi:hypothetical protein
MLLVCCIAVWLKFGMVFVGRVPNARFPYNRGHRNAVTCYLSTLWTNDTNPKVASPPITVARSPNIDTADEGAQHWADRRCSAETR